MSRTVRAAVVSAPGQAPEIRAVELPPLRHDEVRVRLVATGVCHTDVAWADGQFTDRFPVVLGHESAGVVEEVGSAVTAARPGDRVALALAHNCGHCSFCETGQPMLCSRRTEQPQRLTLDGAPVVQGFGTGGFAEQVIVPEASVIPVPEDVPLSVAALVGCATSTGLGAVFNLAAVEYGTKVAILGAGGIGLSVLLGCQVAGAERIVVVDPDARRRERALELGATDAVPPGEPAVRALEPSGFDYVFESAGRAEAMETAVRLARRGGTVTLMGVVPPGTTISLDARAFVPSQIRLLGCLTGNVRPHVDFDRYFRLYRRGLLDLSALVTSTVPLDDIAAGFARSRQGEGIRTLVSLSEE
ncbi:MAG TPA: alcohol dehydrogenase catalytic domain-containing protein [Streptosporangiaceae bacterium]|nr:alcohol dehydrogenase catalytic domain-containing protein [Streptosporangiaceae bacterium]